MVEALFEAGHSDVTLDATNHTNQRRSEWTSTKWNIQHHTVDTPVEVCINRAIDTNQKYLIPVIRRMESQIDHLGGITEG
jgi:hypothetical protein